MGQLIRFNDTNALQQRIRYELDRSINQVVITAKIGAAAIPQIGRLIWLSGNMMMSVLALIREEIEVATTTGVLSRHKVAAHFYHREAYKYEVLDLLEQFNHIVHRLIE